MRTDGKLYWNACRFFRQEVKREIKLAEILKSNGNSNLIWNILNRCIPRKNVPMAAVENPFLLANKFNEFYANVGNMTALKATNLAEEHNLNTQNIEGIHPCKTDRNTGQTNIAIFTMFTDELLNNMAWINGRYLLLFFWTCPRPSTALGMT